MSDYAPNEVAILLALGCIFVRHGEGDHDIWFSPIANRTVVVDGKIKARHTANGILKQMGIAKAF